MRPLRTPAREKAEVLVERAATHYGFEAGAPTGMAEAVRTLRAAALSDEIIRVLAGETFSAISRAESNGERAA
jgi:hypothetical protein